MTLRERWLVAERPSERARQTRSPPRMPPTACANGAARTAPKVVSSGKSGDVTSTVPSYSSIRFTGCGNTPPTFPVAPAVGMITLESERVAGTPRATRLGP